MSKERKTRNFDFLKEPLSELPSREEVIQKTVELTGQTVVVPEVPPSVSTPILAEVKESVKVKVTSKKKVAAKPKGKTPPAPKVQVKESVKEKQKVGRKALEDSRKPFTSTITVENKKRLRQLCADYDIAMSDALNEILSAQFEKRPVKF